MNVNRLVTLQQREPVLSWGTLAAVLNAILLLSLPVAPWIHVVILVAATIAATIAARQQVTPTKPAPEALSG